MKKNRSALLTKNSSRLKTLGQGKYPAKTFIVFIYMIISSLLLVFASTTLDLNESHSKVKVLANIPLIALVLTSWILFSSKSGFKQTRTHFGLFLIVFYFAFPIQIFLPNFESPSPKELNLAKFSTANRSEFDFFNVFSLSIWITIAASLILIGYLRIRNIQDLSIVPICMLFNSLLGLFNNGVNNPYSWGPSWLNSWTAFTYGDSNVGVVNSDEPVHRALTVLFSEGRIENLMLVRRSFPYFLASPLSPVVDNVIIFQFINSIFLVFLLILLHQFLVTLRLRKSAVDAILIVVATFPQVVFYQNQSNGYAIGIIFSSLILFLTIRLLIEGKTDTNWMHLLLVLLFGSLSYDMVLNGFFIALILRTKKITSKSQSILLLMVSILPGLIYEWYISIITETEINKSNSGQVVSVLKNVFLLITNYDPYLIYSRIQSGLSGYLFANGLLFGSVLIFLVMLMKTIAWKNENVANPLMLEGMKLALMISLAAHLFWNLGSGWQFNIPRLTAGFGLFLLVIFLVILSQEIRQKLFRTILSVVLFIQIVVLLPAVFNSYELTWLFITGGY